MKLRNYRVSSIAKYGFSMEDYHAITLMEAKIYAMRYHIPGKRHMVVYRQDGLFGIMVFSVKW